MDSSFLKKIIAIFLLFYSINAHKALLMVEDNEDGTIYIEAGISTGGNASGNIIYITKASSGEPIWDGAVPDSGNFNVPMPSVPYIVTLDMGEGHKVSKRGPFPKLSSSPKSTLIAPKEEIKKSVLDKTEGKILLVSFVPVEKLLKPIVKNTGIKVINVLSEKATINELDEFVKNNDDYLKHTALSADAYVGIRSIYEEEKTFNYLRGENIRLVEIDCAIPFDPTKSGIGIKFENEKPNKNIWLSFSNVAKMSEIVSTDIIKLFPNDSLLILANLKEIKNQIFKLKIKNENLFSSVDNLEVGTIGSTFDYAYEEIGLFTNVKIPINRSKRNELVYQSLKESRIGCLLHQWEISDKEIKDIIEKRNIPVVILSNGLNVDDNRSLAEIINGNYGKIYSALKN